MFFTTKQIGLLKHYSRIGKKVTVKVLNNINQEFEITGIIPNYYEFTNNSFPNNPVRPYYLKIIYGNNKQDFVTIYTNQDEKVSLIIKAIYDENGNLIYKNADFKLYSELINNWVAQLDNQTMLDEDKKYLLKQYLGKPLIYIGENENLTNKECLITSIAKGLKDKELYITVIFDNNQKIKVSINVLNLEKDFQFINENNYLI